jgi:hypothetical protein
MKQVEEEIGPQYHWSLTESSQKLGYKMHIKKTIYSLLVRKSGLGFIYAHFSVCYNEVLSRN